MQQSWQLEPTNRPEWDEVVDVCKATALSAKHDSKKGAHQQDDEEEEEKVSRL
jgi:hypothetical protein